MNISKKNIPALIITIYIVSSLAYIGYDMWNNFKLQYSQQAFLQGQQATIEQLISQAEDSTCQPFSAYTADTEVQLINTDCLSAATEEADNEVAE